jgi:hypothetical protein
VGALVLAIGGGLGGCSTNGSSGSPDGGGASSGAGTFQVTVTGEDVATGGFKVPASVGSEPFFVDGWEVTFSSLLVTLRNVSLSTEPDKAPADPLQTGPKVAGLDGVFAVNLSRPGPQTAVGTKGTAWPLGTLDRLASGESFAADTKYAVSFETAPATGDATRVNFEGNDEADYAEMISKGYTTYYIGTAEFKGTTCTSTDPVLTGLPPRVRFRLGFKKSVAYINCVNPELGAEVRGAQVKSNEAAPLQITVHADHPFWSAFEEDALLRFDAFAFVAQAKGNSAGGVPVVTLEDFAGVPFEPIAAGGRTLPGRTCSPAPSVSNPAGLVYDKKGQAFADLKEFFEAIQMTHVHLNGDGLCAVEGAEHAHGDDHDH